MRATDDLLAFAVYVATLAPTVTLEDAGVLAVAGDHLGVPYPPGYQLWTVLASVAIRLFGWIGFRGFPNPARVRMALAEKGLTVEVEFVAVDVPNGEHRTPAFLAKNPSATVPVLELADGTTIAECTAITEYLDHLTGAPRLTGRTAKERAVIHMMQRRAEAGLLDAVAAYFHHATPGLGPDRNLPVCRVGPPPKAARPHRHALPR